MAAWEAQPQADTVSPRNNRYGTGTDIVNLTHLVSTARENPTERPGFLLS